MPELAQRCMASWRKYFPGWEIREWNEENFDVRAIEYTSQAYDAKSTPLSVIMPDSGFFTVMEAYISIPMWRW